MKAWLLLTALNLLLAALPAAAGKNAHPWGVLVIDKALRAPRCASLPPEKS